MPRRYSFLVLGLFLALTLMGLVWAGLAWGGFSVRGREALSAAAPTWTPTTYVGSPTAYVGSPTAYVDSSTPLPTPVDVSSTPTRPAPTTYPSPSAAIEAKDADPAATAAVPVEGVLTPAPVEQPAAPTKRVDAAGPIPLSTIQPLPVGQGRAAVRLLIPALGLDTSVLPMGWHVVEDANGAHSEWDVVDNAAGHHIDSVLPGEAGNVVLSGHNNIGGAVFRSVCVIGEPGVDFGLGDEMILQDETGRSFVYSVDGWQRFPEAGASIAQRQANAQYLAPTDHAQLTLITCWPPNSNTHRVVVTGLLTGIR